jgi:glycosyltransferase involved in cell wall biosynthesis
MRASLIIPTLNEAESIGHVLASFNAARASANGRLFPTDPLDWEVLVVDGASTDGTADLAEKAGAQVIQEPRKGYGRAYRTGFEAARGQVIATMDGDGTYPTEEIPWLVLHLLEHHLDFITCDRLTYRNSRAMTTEHRIGNWALNSFLSVAYSDVLQGAPSRVLRDSQSGMWIFRRAILDRLRLTQDGMAFSEEFKIEVLLRGFRFEEVPIRYVERWGAPKLSSWRDGVANLEFLLRKRLEIAQERRRAEVGPRREGRNS